MDTPYTIALVMLSVLILVSLYRVVIGPTLFDRLAGLSLIANKTVVLLVLFGFLYHRIDLFVDIALAYSLMGFVGPLVLAKFVELKHIESKDH